MDPLYVIIQDEIRRLIETGVYKDGETIPSEDEIAESYGVSRPTARRAVQNLVEQGLLERRPYHGVIVCPPKIKQGYATVLRSYNDEVRANFKVPRTQVLLAKRMRANAEIASRLELKEGAHVFKLVRLRYADGEPNVLVVSYIPLELYPAVTQVNFEDDTLYGFFEACGNPVVTAHRRLELVKADSNLAAVLDMEKDEAVFRFYTVARTNDGDVAEYAIASYRGQSNVFEFDTNASQVSNLSLENSARINL